MKNKKLEDRRKKIPQRIKDLIDRSPKDIQCPLCEDENRINAMWISLSPKHWVYRCFKCNQDFTTTESAQLSYEYNIREREDNTPNPETK